MVVCFLKKQAAMFFEKIKRKEVEKKKRNCLLGCLGSFLKKKKRKRRKKMKKVFFLVAFLMVAATTSIVAADGVVPYDPAVIDKVSVAIDGHTLTQVRTEGDRIVVSLKNIRFTLKGWIQKGRSLKKPPLSMFSRD